MKYDIFKNKRIFGATALFISLTFTACNKDGNCDYDMPCASEPNSISAGKTVATCYADDAGNPVGVIYDTKHNSLAPLGADWGTDPTNPVGNIHPANWTARDIGQIFGITIDNNESIYLASSDIYYYPQGLSVSKPTSNGSSRPFGAGQIFKCVPPTYTAVPWVNLPSGTDALNGIGNIVFDKVNKQIFATNLEDGKIYRISMAGTVAETYDPWTADTGAPGIVTQGERVWGIGVNYEAGKVKVYFPRIFNGAREIYSLTLNNGAFPPTASEIVEISGVPGTQPIISDLAFSSDLNKMLVAERGDAHTAQVNSYNRSGPSWTFNKRYFIGQNHPGYAPTPVPTMGENAAGGVDFFYRETNKNEYSCDEYFWASGNYMASSKDITANRIYGIEGIRYTGNNPSNAPPPTANIHTDLMIDFDGNLTNSSAKGGIGDVEVFDAAECFNLCNFK